MIRTAVPITHTFPRAGDKGYFAVLINRIFSIAYIALTNDLYV